MATILSQPLMVCNVSIYIPVDVYIFPFQMALSHSTKLSFVEMELLMFKFKVTILSQPTELESVSI